MRSFSLPGLLRLDTDRQLPHGNRQRQSKQTDGYQTERRFDFHGSLPKERIQQACEEYCNVGKE
jgi:hypothetical protein